MGTLSDFRSICREDFAQWCKLLHLDMGNKSWVRLVLKSPSYRRLLDYRIKVSGIVWLKPIRALLFLSSFHLNLHLLYDKKNRTNWGGGDFLYSWFFHHCLLQVHGAQLPSVPASYYRQ